MKRFLTILLSAALCLAISVDASARKRMRDYGITYGVFKTGANNAITDVKGVTVGHRTLDDGDRMHTGVTAIIPHQGNVFRQKCPAAVYVGNGFGKLAGSTQIQELGTLETPIILTNTLNPFSFVNVAFPPSFSALVLIFSRPIPSPDSPLVFF